MMAAILLLVVMVQKEYFPYIVQKSRVQYNNCNHTAFVVHVKNLSLKLRT